MSALDYHPKAGEEDKPLSQKNKNSIHLTAVCGGLDGGTLLKSVIWENLLARILQTLFGILGVKNGGRCSRWETVRVFFWD